MTKTFDKTLKLIIEAQTTLLSRGQNPDKTDRCRYQTTALTDDNYPGKEGQVYVDSVSFSFGIHPDDYDWYMRTIDIFQDKIQVRSHDWAAPQSISPPWWYATTYNPSGDAISVHVTEAGNTVTIESDDCPWKLVFVRGGFESKIHLSVGDRYKPVSNNGESMDGICGNCDGAFDYVLCGQERTDVSDAEDKYHQISDSCELTLP